MDTLGKAVTSGITAGLVANYYFPNITTPPLKGIIGQQVAGSGDMKLWKSAAVAGMLSSVATDATYKYLLPQLERQLNIGNPGQIVQKGMSGAIGMIEAQRLMDPRFLESSIGYGTSQLMGLGAAAELVSSAVWPVIAANIPEELTGGALIEDLEIAAI